MINLISSWAWNGRFNIPQWEMREITNISTRLFLLLTVEFLLPFHLLLINPKLTAQKENKLISQVKIFHILAIFVFNHFRLQTLISTKRDAEIVPFNSTFLILIIFILNSKFASVLNCLHWRKWTISSCHSIFVPPEPQLYLLIRGSFHHWATNIWDGRGWQGESSASRVGRQIEILRISPQSYLNSLIWDVSLTPNVVVSLA